MSRFENPYNFVPIPERPQDGPLADAGAEGSGGLASHARYHPDRWSGRITVSMTTLTPLLIPEKTGEEQIGGSGARHTIHGIRRGPDGKPLIPPTSVKGMLRSAYEALTNSRFGVFEDHDKRLGMRPDPGEALRMVPAIVRGREITLLKGTTPVWPSWDDTPDTNKDDQPKNRWRVSNRPQFAAWLPMTNDSGTWRYMGGKKGRNLPSHGEKIKCRLIRRIHPEKNFAYWEVVAICRINENLPQRLDSNDMIGDDTPSVEELGISHHKLKSIDVDGWVVINGNNIEGKHHERVFFDAFSEKVSFCLTERIRADWNHLMDKAYPFASGAINIS